MPQDTTTLTIARGGRTRCSAPRTPDDQSNLFAVVVDVSLLLGGAPVQARDWLPGLHLFVRA